MVPRKRMNPPIFLLRMEARAEDRRKRIRLAAEIRKQKLEEQKRMEEASRIEEEQKKKKLQQEVRLENTEIFNLMYKCYIKYYRNKFINSSCKIKLSPRRKYICFYRYICYVFDTCFLKIMMFIF